MNVLFQQLYGMIAMSAMDAKIEEQLQHSLPPDERMRLEAIYASNDMDERHALCAQRLGYHEQAQHLFDRVQQKRTKRHK